MSAYLRSAGLLAAFALLGFALYVLMFWAGAGSSITILFYRGILLALLAALVTGAAAAWLTRGTGDKSLPIAAAATAFSANICFLIVFPVTVDRSVTVYLLSRIEQQERGISRESLERLFVEGYVVDMHAIDRRIDEQGKSGNLALGPDGKVRLTAQGRRFMALSRVIARLFGTDPRFVEPSRRAPAPAARPAP